MEDEAIGVKEVMKILKYSDSQVYKMVASGALKTLKIPGVRFSKRYIMSILESGCAGYNPEYAMLEKRLKQEQEKNKKLQALSGRNRQPKSGGCKKGGFGLMKRFYLVDDDFLDAVDDLADKVGDIDVYGHPVLDASAVMILGKDLEELQAKRQKVQDMMDDGFYDMDVPELKESETDEDSR